jgi:aconitate hydratase
MLAITFADKNDYGKIRETDRISVDTGKFSPEEPLNVTLVHADGTRESFKANHTYNELQIKWFRAGSALNSLK